MYIRMYVCMYACMHVCRYVCMKRHPWCMYVSIPVNVCMHGCMGLDGWTDKGTDGCRIGWMCISIRMYTCIIHVYVFVYTYVYIYIYVWHIAVYVGISRWTCRYVIRTYNCNYNPYARTHVNAELAAWYQGCLLQHSKQSSEIRNPHPKPSSLIP